MGQWNLKRGPWNVVMGQCNVKGPWNVNRDPWNVIMGPRNVNSGPCNVIM